MELRVATLCDFAQIREGLLFISSGGVTRVRRSQYPVPLGLMVALLFDVTPAEANDPHEVRMRVETEDGSKLAEMSGAFQVTPGPANDPGEIMALPMVADFRSLEIKQAGRYQIAIDPPPPAQTVALAFRCEFPSDAPKRP